MSHSGGSRPRSRSSSSSSSADATAVDRRKTVATAGRTAAPTTAAASVTAAGDARPRELWTTEEQTRFFAALRKNGKNFERIRNAVRTKNREQVRHYYYRLARKVHKLRAADATATRIDDELYAVLCYGQLRRALSRVDRRPSAKRFATLFHDLVETGCAHERRLCGYALRSRTDTASVLRGRWQ